MSTDTLYFYIRRHTQSVSRVKGKWSRKPRGHYYKFFIKRAERAGILEYAGRYGVWMITDKVLESDING